MSSWKKSKLSEVINIIGGGTPKRSEEKYWNGNIPWLSVADFNNDLRFVSSSAEYITELGLSQSSTKLLKRGDLIISARGTVGCLAQLDKPMAFNQSCYGLNGKENIIDNGFLYYFLKNNIKELKQKTHGAVFDTITRDTFEYIEIYYPDIKRQKEIAEILEDYDQKIQLNTQINQTLEQIAQTIFKSWFIDFDPVHAKANALASGQTAEQATQAAMAVISGKNTQELHRLQTANPEQYQQLWEITEAFPSGFDEEGVPRGWEEKFFGELLENTIGGDWGKDEVDEKHTEKVSILRGTDLPDVYKGNDKDVPTRFVEQKKLKSRKLQHSDIVIEVSGGSKNQPTGRSLLITDKLLSRFNNPIVPASFCRLFRPKSENYGYLLALHLQIIYQQGKTWEYQNQSTGISNFQTTHFLETEKVILPTNKTLMYFAEMVNPIFDKIYSDENQRLAEIRDELLPKLLSGEV